MNKKFILVLLILIFISGLFIACPTPSGDSGDSGDGGDSGDSGEGGDSGDGGDDPIIPINGDNWTQATDEPAWEDRYGHSSLTYDSKIWLFGGRTSLASVAEVWNTTDGINWTQVTSTPGWDERNYHECLVFDDKMWIMGGLRDTSGNRALLNDVWYSTDGATWTQATSAAGWAGRRSFSAVVYDGKMWVLGGRIGDNPTDYVGDVWNSTDGITWTEVASTTAWGPRRAHRSVRFDNMIWVIGGLNSDISSVSNPIPLNPLNDVWYSTDGITWTEATSGAGWSARFDHQSQSTGDKMWVISGSGSATDVWYSTDGTTWTEAVANAGFPSVTNFSSAIHNDKMWVMGGINGFYRQDFVWYTD